MSWGVYSTAAQVRSVIDMMFCRRWYPLLNVDPVPLNGKNAIVTGANIGIGLEAARKLASYGATVTLACRNPVKAETARQDIMGSTGNESVKVKLIDFSSLASVRAFVADWGETPIDILINNAGATFNQYNKTIDGYESTYQTNFLSHVLLTILLLPRLTLNARIVNVSSYGQYEALRRGLDPNDLDGSKYLDSQGIKEGDFLQIRAGAALYNKTKLDQVVFTKALQERLDASTEYSKKNILVSSCHPGAVLTAIHERHLGTGTEEYQKLQTKWVAAMNKIGISAEQGACTPVFLSVDPSVKKWKGAYWDRLTPRTPNSLVDDDKLGAEMWTAWMQACLLQGAI